MPKGRKPKGEYSGKSSVFSTRISPELRKKLEKAAKQSGRSLSQEVEHRLRGSFAEDETIVDLFGDRQTYRMMRMMADAIHIARTREEGELDWLNHPMAFQLAKEAILSILDQVAPDVAPIDGLQAQAKVTGSAIAGMLWEKVCLADSAIPLGKKSRAAVAKADLLSVLDRTTHEIHGERLREQIETALKESRNSEVR